MRQQLWNSSGFHTWIFPQTAIGAGGLREPSGARPLMRLGGDVAGSSIWLASDEIPGPHHAFALDLNDAPLLEHEVVFQPSIDVLGHLDPADGVSGLHPGCDVDRVAPDVVEEPARTHYARDDGSARQPDPQRQRITARILQ